MASPKKNTAYIFYMPVIDAADSGSFKAGPTIAAGDFKVSTAGSAFANLATLPVVDPAGSISIKISLSAGEMNGDKIVIQAIDAAGDEWNDVLAFIDADAVNPDDLVRSVVPANKLNVSAAGNANADVKEIRSDATAADNLLADYDGSGFDKGFSSIGVASELGGTAKLNVRTEVDAALDAAIPGSPTANSINERIKTLDDNYTADRAANLGNLDAKITTRAAKVDYTAARAALLDKLNVAGNVASSGEVTAIQNNTRIRIPVPGALERPDSGSVAYELNLYLYDTAGNMEDADGVPTITARNESAADRSSDLSSVSQVSTGHYKCTYSVASGHAIEQVMFEWTVVEGGISRKHGTSVQVVDTTAVDFTAADRTKLDAIHGKLPSGSMTDAIDYTATRAGKIDNLDVVLSSRPDAQEVRDAMKLAPAGGAPAAGSVDKHLDDIEQDTTTDLPAQVGGLNDLSDQAVRDAMKLAPSAGSPTAGSVDKHLDDIEAGQGTVSIVLGAIQVVTTGGVRIQPPIILEQFTNETKTFALTILDAAGVPIDLTGQDLRFVVQDSNDPPIGVFKVDDGGPDLTISGDNSEVVKVIVADTKVTTATMEWHWRLWNLTSDSVLAHGPFLVHPAKEDVP